MHTTSSSTAQNLAGKIRKPTQLDRSHALRGNAAWDAPRPASQRYAQVLRNGDAERHGMHYHAERGNDQIRSPPVYNFMSMLTPPKPSSG